MHRYDTHTIYNTVKIDKTRANRMEMGEKTIKWKKRSVIASYYTFFKIIGIRGGQRCNHETMLLIGAEQDGTLIGRSIYA